MTTTANQSSEVESAISAAKQLKATYAALKTRRDGVQLEVNRIDDRIQTLRRMPIQREEAKAFIFGHIDYLAGRFPQDAQLSRVFEAYAAPAKGMGSEHRALCLEDMEKAKQTGADVVVDLPLIQNFFAGGLQLESRSGGSKAPYDMAALDARRVYFFFGDIIKKKIDQYFDSLFPKRHYAAEGDGALTIAQKREEIGKLSEQREDLAQQLATFEEQLQTLADLGAVTRNAFGVIV